jgi:hypothetical protein
LVAFGSHVFRRTLLAIRLQEVHQALVILIACPVSIPISITHSDGIAAAVLAVRADIAGLVVLTFEETAPSAIHCSLVTGLQAITAVLCLRADAIGAFTAGTVRIPVAN